MTMNIQERVQELFNRFNVNLTVTEDKQEMAEAVLDNGTVIYTDAEGFNEGAEAYIINDEGERIPLPAGSYELQGGGVLNIGENGMVEGVDEAEAVEEVVEETEPQPQTAMETQEQEFDDTPVTREVVAQMIREALAEMMEPGEEKEDKEEMSLVDPEAPSTAPEPVEEPKKASKKAQEKEAPAKEELSAVKEELEAVRMALESLKKEAASKGVQRMAPTKKVEPIDLKSLTTQERVRALANQFSK